MRAVQATIIDIKRQIIGDAIASSGDIRNGSRTGGLRSGVAIYSDGVITLRKVVYVPGVTVSGFFSLRASAGTTRLLVRGSAAARGSITIDGQGVVAGVLGGRRIHTSASAARRSVSSRAGLPSFPYPLLRAP